MNCTFLHDKLIISSVSICLCQEYSKCLLVGNAADIEASSFFPWTCHFVQSCAWASFLSRLIKTQRFGAVYFHPMSINWFPRWCTGYYRMAFHRSPYYTCVHDICNEMTVQWCNAKQTSDLQKSALCRYLHYTNIALYKYLHCANICHCANTCIVQISALYKYLHCANICIVQISALCSFVHCTNICIVQISAL